MTRKQRLLQLLKRTGLTNTEATFYLTANANAGLTMKELQTKSGLSHSSIYRAYERLKELDLINSSPDNWRKNITVAPLNALAEKLVREQRHLKKVELELRQLSTLNNLQSLSDDSVEIITNQDKITEKIYEILVKPWNTMLCYGSVERLIDMFGEKTEMDFIRQRCNRGKHAYGYLTELGPFTKFLIPRCDQELRHIKIHIDPTKQDYATYIYDDEISIWRVDKNLGKRAIIIKDPAIAESYINMFTSLWNRD